MIYLDYAANTPVDPAVLEVFCAAERAHPGNPNSAHQAGRAARQELDCCTAGIASLLGCLPEEILYTSGASESNNLAVKGIAHAARHVGRHILSTALEHPSVGGSLTALQQQGYEIDLVDMGRDGTVDVDQLRSLLRRDTVLVSLCAVDSELGTVQPIGAVAEALRTFPDCRLHVDATQALGKTPLCLDGVDTMSFALHKLHGLNGSGLLFKRSGLVLEPQIHGGAGVSLYRSGTPTLALAAAVQGMAFAGNIGRICIVVALYLIAGYIMARLFTKQDDRLLRQIPGYVADEDSSPLKKLLSLAAPMIRIAIHIYLPFTLCNKISSALTLL